MAKFGMSLCTLGMAAEFRGKVAVNSLWPITAIDTAAVRFALGGDAMAAECRTPDILADAAYAILSRPVADCSGNFFIDEEVLRAEGVTDFSRYSPGSTDQASRCRATSSFPTPSSIGRRRRSSEGSDAARRPRTFDSIAEDLPHLHRITSSARTSSACGIVSPSALAVLRLITRSNRVVCSMARSPGLAPFRI